MTSPLGTLWTTITSGIGGGVLQGVDGVATFIPDLTNPVGAGGLTITNIPSLTTPASYQIASVQLANLPEEGVFGGNAAIHLWTNISNFTTSVQDGIQFLVNSTNAEIHAVQGGVDTVLNSFGLPSLPSVGDVFTVISGDINKGVNNLFTVLQNGAVAFIGLLNGVSGILSAVGQKIGLGITAGEASLSGVLPPGLQNFLGIAQPTPPAAISTGALVTRNNGGDQPMFDRYICYGPGTFSFSDGPGGSGTVVFGPLLAGQVAMLNTDPTKRGVIDLTPPGVVAPVAPSSGAQAALEAFLSWATGNNYPPLLAAIESRLGAVPPQGPLYALLQGRFSDNAAIPPGSGYQVSVGIAGGDGTSQVVAVGTPLRRWPQ